MEQIPPTVTWGKQFLLVPFPESSMHHFSRIRQYYTKIVVSEGENNITQTCNNELINSIFLNFPGDWNLNYNYIDPVTYCTIESDKPILVSQLVSEGHVRNSYYNYSFLHEILMVIPPIKQYINKVVYVPLNISLTNSYDHHYIQITTTDTTDVLLDDKSYNWDWQPIHGNNSDIIGYGTVHEFDDTLPHVLHHTDITAGLSVIGYGSMKGYYFFANPQGYTYLTGMNLNINNTGLSNNLISIYLIVLIIYIVLDPTVQESADDNNLGVIVGVVVGLGVLLLVIVIIVLVVVLVLKKKTTKKSLDSQDLEMPKMSNQL